MHAKLFLFVLALGAPLGALGGLPAESSGAMALELNSRRELFVDDYLIERKTGMEVRLNSPVSKETVFKFDQPWEGNIPFHITVLQDGAKYRMYYRGAAHSDYLNKEALNPGEPVVPNHEAVTAYAESDDGIHWRRPVLGQVEFNGSRNNNILDLKGVSKFAPFLDTNPQALPDRKYKALAFYNDKAKGKKGLVPLGSADGVTWEPMAEEPVITDGVFDSHNIGFWDGERQCYVAIYRDFTHGVRSIKQAVSRDFLHWSPGVWADFGDAPLEDLYTNATVPYDRAPHLYLAFPKRFVPWRRPQHLSAGMVGISEALFMSSRDGVHWRKFNEAFIRPGPDRRNWVHRSNFVARGLLSLAPGELSLYVLRNYTYPSVHLERMVIRTDGFVSLHAGYPGGEMVTKPFRFTGNNLFLNYATSAAGRIQVEIQDERGVPIPGYSLAEAQPIWGDEIDGMARWSRPLEKKDQGQLGLMQGRIVRLRFVMMDADLFSLQFR